MEPSPEKPKTVILKCFSDILEEAGADIDDDNNTYSSIDKYFREPLPSTKTLHLLGGQITVFDIKCLPNWLDGIFQHLQLLYHRKGYSLVQVLYTMTSEIDLHLKRLKLYFSLKTIFSIYSKLNISCVMDNMMLFLTICKSFIDAWV